MPEYAKLEDVPRISVSETQRRRERGEPTVIVDVRSAADYAAGHIAGSVHIPLREIPRRFNELPRDALLVFY